MKRVIRSTDASKLEFSINPKNKDDFRLLTSKYVLLDKSLEYFKKYSPQVSEAFTNNLVTKNEMCYRFRDYFSVNNEYIQLTISREVPNAYDIKLFAKDTLELKKKDSINKYLLLTMMNLYGYGVKNSEYLVAWKWLYRFEREASDVQAYMTVTSDKDSIIYTPHSKIIYKDSSVERLVGEIVVDTLEESPLNHSIRRGVTYKRDILSNGNYVPMEGKLPFE